MVRVEGESARVRFGADEVLITRWEPFADLCKRRFLWYYPSYLAGIEAERKKHGTAVADGTTFSLTPFESPGNGMAGVFNYTNIEERLRALRKALANEEQDWIKNGTKAAIREAPLALGFQNTFKAMVQKFKHSSTPLDLELIDDNPFAWRIIIYGRPMTNLDGGIFKVRIIFSVNFPQEQPRVTVETPLFHHRITDDGTLCYFLQKQDEIASHIEGITKAIEDEGSRYDPRAAVNQEASKLFWGTAEQKKIYNRKLRRSAQDSAE